MSTRSRICVRLKDSDLDRDLVQDPSLVPAPFESWEAEGESAPAPPAHPCLFPADKGPYISVFHHFDGYPDGLGEWLYENADTYEAALNLVLGGDISYAIGAVRYYAARGMEWEDVKPQQTEAPADNDLWIEYVYTFEDGEWFVTPSAPTKETDEHGIPVYGTGDRAALREVFARDLIDDGGGHWVSRPDSEEC